MKHDRTLVIGTRGSPLALAQANETRDCLKAALGCSEFHLELKPIKARDLGPAINLAMARFALHQAAQQEAAGLRLALEERKLIERAKGTVMRRLRVDETDAFRRLRRLSSDRNWKVIEKAQADCTSRGRWVGSRRIGYHRRDGVARAGRVVPATPGRSHRRSRMSDTTRRRPAPPRA